MKFNALMIGQELLQGKIQDRNLHFLAQYLHKKGHKLGQVRWVNDIITEIAQAMQELSAQGEVVICSGGLGPTEDDLTKLALAQLLNQPLSFCPRSYEFASLSYQRYNKTINQDHPYALMPEGLEFVHNQRGIAPGLILWGHQYKIFCAPGVPFEFQDMIAKQYLPLIEERCKNPLEPANCTATLTVRTIGIPEEELFLRRFPGLWEQISSFGDLSSLPEYLGVTLSLNLRASTPKLLAEKFQAAKLFFDQHPMSPAIWAYEEGPLENILYHEMLKASATIAVAESCTGGLIQTKITSVAGSSAIFPGGFVTYTESQKEKTLGITHQFIQAHGVVSEEVAKAMAEAARQLTNSTISLSTTGIAGPSGGDETNPIGSGWIGISTDVSTKAMRFQFRGQRTDIQERFARQALYLALMELRYLRSTDPS